MIRVFEFVLTYRSMCRKHTMKDTESRSRATKKAEDSDGTVYNHFLGDVY